MKAKLFCGICAAFMVMSVNAVPRAYWPGYIDNIDCLKGNLECAEKSFESMKNGGSPTSLDEGLQFWADWKFGWQHYNNTEDKNYELSYFEVHLKPMIAREQLDMTRPLDYKDGLPLKTAHGEPTGYLLKGFGANEESAFNIEYMLCTKYNNKPYDDRCTPDKDWKFLRKFTFDDLVEDIDDPNNKDWGALLTLDKSKGIYGFRITTGDPRFRLAYRGNQPQDVRSLRLPAITLRAIIMYKNAQGKEFVTRRFASYAIRRPALARLNHRTCYLNVDKQTIDFGAHHVYKNQSGKIGDEISTTLKLKCNAETEELDFGGHVDDGATGQPRPTFVHGSQVIHSVKKVEISPTLPTTNIGGQQAIGLEYIGLTPSNKMAKAVASDQLYVEGSLKQGLPCGSEALKIGQDAKDAFLTTLKADPVTDENIKEFDYSTIYWKLCKKPGAVDYGHYKGNAKITIQYK